MEQLNKTEYNNKIKTLTISELLDEQKELLTLREIQYSFNDNWSIGGKYLDSLTICNFEIAIRKNKAELEYIENSLECFLK